MSNEVDKSVSSGDVMQLRPWEKFTDHLQREAQANDKGNKDVVTTNQVDKVLSAETIEDVWDADEGGMYALKDLVGMELSVISAKTLPSKDETKRNIFGVWLLMECSALTENKRLGIPIGEVIMINTGVPTVIAKIKALQGKGVDPIEFMVQGIPSGGGEMVRLRPIPRRAVQADAK
jgi:hypothetical protein